LAASGRPFGETMFGVRPSLERGLVFVMMALRGTDKLYAAVRDECAKLNLRATRVDEHIGSGPIIQDVYLLIAAAEFIVCDLTQERPNVYYELGYAHGIGNKGDNILLLAKAKTKLHFDIAPLRVQFYRSEPHLREVVYRSLKGMKEATRASDTA
jgi:hypothetical protein